jgi:hypothetical protein
MGCPKNFVLTFWKEFSLSNDLSLAESNNELFFSEFACYFLVVWLSCQLIFLQLQQFYGPRFCIPKRYLPSHYDYTRPIPSSALQNSSSSASESSLPPISSSTVIGTSHSGDVEMGRLAANSGSVVRNPLIPSTPGEESSSHAHPHDNIFECVICYNHIGMNEYMVRLSVVFLSFLLVAFLFFAFLFFSVSLSLFR